jgi:hypothetical protein
MYGDPVPFVIPGLATHAAAQQTENFEESRK